MWLEIKTILLAMMPINELRGTIPIAILLFELTPLKAFFLACLGNMLPIVFLLWFWKYLSENWASKNKLVKKFLKWIFQRTRKRFYKNLPRSARKNLVTRFARNKNLPRSARKNLVTRFDRNKNLPRSARKNLVTRFARNKKYAIWVDLGLILLVAIPLPFTGAWTGSIAAFLFGISYGRSLGLISIGVLIAGAVVTIITTGIYSFL